MFDAIKQNKVISVVIVLIIVVFAWLGMREPQSSSALSSENSSGITSNDQEIVRVLLDMRSIGLDSSIFENTAFQSLQDNGTEIQQEPVGKTNPFEEAAMIAGSVSSNTETNGAGAFNQ